MKDLRVCIDPGHGGKDPGAVNGSKHEAVATLAIAKKVGALLKKKGITVKYTRSSDKYVSLEDRCKISNEFGADAFVSIHLNASTNKDAEGLETWRYKTVGSRTKKLAENVQTELISATGWRNRGTKTTETLYVLKKTKAHAILIECGFISNAEESKALFCSRCQDRIAHAVVKGIEKTFL